MSKKKHKIDDRIRLFCHSNTDMHELADDEVTLTITSPPYWNAIDYDLHAADDSGSVDYRQRKYAKGYDGYDEYLEALVDTFCEVHRVTKPGGFCAIVIGTVLNNGAHIPVPFDTVSLMVRLGWEFHQDIIWHKCTAGVKRAGVCIQKPFPGYFYPNIMTEYVLLFRKSGAKLFSNRSAQEKDASRYPINGLFTKEIANNVWHIAPVPPGKIDHPCPFPEEIPDRLIRLYSYEGDVVLDPYVGSGQTTKTALLLGRRGVGYDVEKRYIDMSFQRAGEASAVRPQQLVAEFAKMALDAPLVSAKKSISSSHGKTRHGSGRNGKDRAASSPSDLFSS